MTYTLFQLMVMDVYTGRNIQIPSLKSSDESPPADCPCGIHAIALNPSESLLATGGENTNDLAVYMLPTFDPVMVGEVSIKIIRLMQYILRFMMVTNI